MNCKYRSSTRREFLTRATSGAALLGFGGGTAGYACRQGSGYTAAWTFASRSTLPGPYRGRVVGVTHPQACDSKGYNAEPIRQMIRWALKDLTGAADHVAAWRQFVQPGDVVCVKVNPNGLDQLRSSQPFFLEILDGLVQAGVRQQDVLVYERYKDLLDLVAGWFPPWARTAAAADSWNGVQQEMGGYDPENWIDFDGLLTGQDPNNVTARRSHAALVLSRMVTKVINCCILKTHQASGVTLSLKNLSHGFFNNANRSHPSESLNYTGTYIPTVVAHPLIRSKVVLNIIDGVHGLYHAGPWGDPSFVWEHKTIYMATDPVALDKIGWREIDRKRAAVGRSPVAVAPKDPPHFNFVETQPQHVDLAGAMGLGESRLEHIDYRQRVLA